MHLKLDWRTCCAVQDLKHGAWYACHAQPESRHAEQPQNRVRLDVGLAGGIAFAHDDFSTPGKGKGAGCPNRTRQGVHLAFHQHADRRGRLRAAVPQVQQP